MADEKQRGKGTPGDEFGDFDEEVKPSKGSDFGALSGGAANDEGSLGNLPPLSDFESESGRGLPPISDDAGGRFDSGLPPLGDIQTEVPRPTGGNVRPAPPGFEKSAFDTPISDSGLDTPQTPRSTSFQDLTTDSDFSPETPEIGPGPDSDLETPMFDSAFGPGSAFDRTPDTSAPTQAMETPMFGDRSRNSGFDADAFGTSSRGGGAMGGTPIPDFSPDTGMPGRVPPAPPMMTPPPMARESGGGGAGKLIIGAIIGLLIGAAALMFLVEKIPFAPATARIADLESQKQTADARVQSLEAQIRELQSKTGGTDGTPLPNIDELLAKATQLQDQIATSEATLAEKTAVLNGIQSDIEKRNAEFAKANEDYDNLLNQTAIERARSEGLAAEVTRLQSQVGQLEEAAARATSVKESLVADVNRLEVMIQESSRLAPAKYSYEQRLQDVQALKADLARSPVVTPELMTRYAQLHERENQISGAREYFFARIPVKDRYGVTREKWAEALMNGNWSVYFRTLDGSDIGVYEKVANTDPPQYTFRQFLSAAEENSIEQQIISARTPGYQEKINALAQREVTMDNTTGLQRVFDSL